MNEQDIEFMRDARGKAAVKNYNQVMENPLISYMLALIALNNPFFQSFALSQKHPVSIPISPM